MRKVNAAKEKLEHEVKVKRAELLRMRALVDEMRKRMKKQMDKVRVLLTYRCRVFRESSERQIDIPSDARVPTTSLPAHHMTTSRLLSRSSRTSDHTQLDVVLHRAGRKSTSQWEAQAQTQRKGPGQRTRQRDRGRGRRQRQHRVWMIRQGSSASDPSSFWARFSCPVFGLAFVHCLFFLFRCLS